MQSPKALFQKSAGATKHNDAVNAAEFQSAVHTALAQMAMDLTPSSDPDAQRDNSSRIMGARQFIATLMNLGIAEPTPTKPKSDNLTRP